jgi:ABC-type phosphate transport system substrate-binding protein
MRGRFATALVLLGILMPAIAGGGDPRIAVIVHRDRHDSLDIATVARIFLRQRRFWEDGSPVLPINREAGSALREQFSQRVLGAASEQLASYWNAQYFHGVLPPATLSSSQSIRRFVASERDAIGYVEADAVDDTVRIALDLD